MTLPALPAGFPEPDLQNDKVRLWFNLPEPLYRHELKSISQSTLKSGVKSAADLRHAMTAEFKESPAMLKGTCAHQFILEPSGEALMERAPDGYTGNKKADQELKDAKQAEGITLVPQDLYDDALAITEVVESSDMAQTLLGEYDGTDEWEKWSEVSMQWVHHSDPSVVIKGRIDRMQVHPDRISLIDLKTANPSSFEAWRERKFKYDMQEMMIQASLYRQAIHHAKGLLNRLGKPVTWHWIIIESEPPFKMQFLTPNERMIKVGNSAVELCINRYSRGMKTDEWPGYAETIIDFSTLPPWSYQYAKETVAS